MPFLGKAPRNITTNDIDADTVISDELTINNDATVSGDLTVSGNVQIDGTQTVINTATLDVEDKNITVAKNSANSFYADGGGLTVDIGVSGANATLSYSAQYDAWLSNKDFGIGTVAAQRLDVREEKTGGGVLIQVYNSDNSDTTTQTAGIAMGPDTRGGTARITAVKENADFSTNAGRDVALTFSSVLNNSPTERMRITSDGAVLIGTDSGDSFNSNSLLRIQQPSNPTYIQVKTANNQTGGLLFGDTDDDFTGGFFYQNNDDTLTVYTNNAEAMRISSAGNVSIGNTNATYILDVDVGAPSSSDQVLGRFSSQNGIRDIGFVWDDSASTLGVATLTNHSLTFHTGGNSNERMRIDTSGNVGIGTTTPDTKLHVSGGINTGPATAGSTDAAFIVSNADDAYGIHMNVSGSSGAGFISAQRNDGSATVYDLVLQPTGGRLRSPAQYGLGKTGESYDNDQSFEKFNFKLGNTSSNYANVWMKVCTITIPDTAYTAISIIANFKYNNNNFGNTDYLSENLTHIRIYRNQGGGTGASVSASLYGMDGPQSDNIRVYVTSASTAEIQVKHTVNNRAMHVDFQIVDHNGAIELDHVTSPTTGTTSGGTAVTPNLSNSATTGRWLALNGLMINQQGLYAAGNQLAAQNTVWNKSVATWNKQATVSGTGYFHSFVVNNSDVGSISTNGTTTAYNTTSDYRLKENIVDLTGAIDRLKQIPVHRFNFIAAANTTVDGFLAHEVSDVVPEAVSGEKDAVETVYDEEANTSTEVAVYQGIDQSKLVPLLTAALKEAILRIETLEAAQANTA